MKFLIADDHPIIRKGINQILQEISAEYQIDEVENAQEAIINAEKNNYDIVILDISMPNGGGLKALKEIKKIKPNTSVLMLSIYDDKQYILSSLKSGASGYMTKKSAPYELKAAIDKITNGGKYISPDISDRLISIFDSDYHIPKHETLTNREFEILGMLAEGQTTNSISTQLHLSPQTVSTYKMRIYEKMEFKNNTDLVKYALKFNLIE